MENRFNFNGFDLSTWNNFEYAESFTFNPKASPATSAEEGSMIDEPLFNRSSLIPPNSYEISFQKGFMAEHASVFTGELEKYMESVRTFLQDYDPSLLRRFPEGLSSVHSGMNFEEVLMMTGCDMSESTKNAFITQVKNFEKLGEFLNLVADNCPSEIAVELIHVAQQILHQFLASEHRNNVYVEEEILLDLALEKGENLQGLRMLDLSLLPKVPEELRRKFRRFINIFCATTVLVIGQFFANPYSGGEVSDLKRALSPFWLQEEEQDLECIPQKKRKFSF